MKVKDQLINWLKEIARFEQVEKFAQFQLAPPGYVKVVFFTNDHSYAIVANENYLGCVASTRKPRAGEGTQEAMIWQFDN